MLILWLLLQTSFGQNKAKSLVLNYISKEYDTEIKVDHVDISFFDELTLENIFIEDSNQDTLLYADKLEVDFSLFSYFNEKILIDEIKLKGAKINISELSNAKYNFHKFTPEPFEKSSSEKEKPNEWEFDLKTIDLEDTEILFTNNENSISSHIDSFQGELESISIDTLLFHFKSLDIDGIDLVYEKSNSSNDSDPPTLFPALPFHLVVDDLSIDGNDLLYTKKGAIANDTSFDPNYISIEKLDLKGKDFFWTDTIGVNLERLYFKMSDGFEANHFASDLSLTNQFLSFDNTSLKTTHSDISFSGNSRFESFDALINDFHKSQTSVQLNTSKISNKDLSYFIDTRSFKEINLDYVGDFSINADLVYNEQKLKATNLSISSLKKLELDGNITLENISDLKNSRHAFDINHFKTSQNALTHIFPSLTFPKEINQLGNISGQAAGVYRANNLLFHTLNIQTSQGTKLKGNGTITEFQNGQSPQIDFNFDQFETDINSLVSDHVELPEEIKNLQRITYSGNIKGNIFDLAAKGNLSTTLGKLDLNASAQFDKNFDNMHYNGFINLRNFELGTMLNDTLFGIANFEGRIDGSGLTLNQLNASVDGKVSSFFYDGNTYNDITVDGKYRKDIFDGKLVSKDKNLNLNFDGKMDLSGETAVIDFAMDLKNFDLKELGIVDSLMILGGKFKGNIKGDHIDEIVGSGVIENLSIETAKGKYFADSNVVFKIEEINNNVKSYTLESSFLDSEVKGNIKPSKLVRVINNYINTYIPLETGYDENDDGDQFQNNEEAEDQNFIISAKTKDINSFLIPFLGHDTKIKEASFGANFSSKESRLDIQGRIDSLLYKGILFQKGSYFFDGKEDLIYGNVYIEDISTDNEILVPKTDINIVLNDQIADFNILLEDENDIERLDVEGYLTRTDEYILTFEDSIALNGHDWAFSPYNQIIFGEYGLYMQDLSISKGDQAITLYTDENENGEAIEVLFDDFVLSELTSIIDKQNDYFEGKINGSLLINSLYSEPFITADLGLKNVTIDGHEAGNLSIEAVQDNAKNSVHSTIQLSGFNNDATMVIDFGITDKTTKGQLDIQKLEMSVVDPFLTDIFINSEGYINGKINIDGSLSNLDLKGKIKTHNVKTTPVFTNSRYEVLDTEVSFTDRVIDFGTVELKDRNNNSAFVSGKIKHKNLRSSIVDLKVDTEKFEFLNTTENENELFFGNVNVEGNVSVYGPIDDIEVDGTVTAIDNSKLYVSPLSAESELAHDDFIIYSGDPRKVQSDSVSIDITNSNIKLPFDIDMKVNVGEDSEFAMILDPITGDKITCYGKSNLILKLSKEAKMELFGTYTVTRGVYTFSYGLITKEFKIQPGGTVTLNGDPLEGILNVGAVYVAQTAVYDLLKLESNLSEFQKAEARRQKNINVILSLSKSISKPEIKLDITAEEDELSPISELLNTKLAQLRTDPNEMNNQVFGLLLFNNFILARNTDTDFAKTGTNLLISSISGLVSSQLNKLADGLIKGVEVNFDVNSYSSDYLALGQEGVITEFGVGVKKSLFDDRLSISVGTNINLESSSSKSEFNTIAGDFILEWKANKKGSYTLKAFRKSSFDRLIDENSSKNGGSIFKRWEFGEIRKKENKH